MKAIHVGRINWALMVAVLFSATCWLALYAVWADLGPHGFELAREASLTGLAGGFALVALHAFGLLFLLGCGVGAVALATKPAAREPGDPRRRRLQG